MPDLRPVDREPDEAGGGDFRSRPRWSANRKMDVVMRLLRGESLDSLSRELGVEAHRLAAWRDDFIVGGKEALKARPGTGSAEESRRLREAERKVGQLTMEVEILQAAARKRGLRIPPPKRPR
jgi:transposase